MAYQYFEPTQEELEIEQAIVEGKAVSVITPAIKRKYEQIAKATMAKTKNINIRLTESDLFKLKSAAAREGIPYQTLAGSLIHKHVNQPSSTS
jgi:predicted DNA binding CopG/RHH family protein